MADFLLELRSEEIPARMQPKAAQDLERLFTAALKEAGVTADSIETHATPRRLALIARGLPAETAATSEERRGPRTDAPDKALEGFLRGAGLTRDQLEAREEKKGSFWYARLETPGRAMADIIAEAVPALIRAFPWPKSMRWGADSQSSESLRWVRPLEGIIALLGGAVVPFEIAGIASGRVTRGHRFMSSGDIEIAEADDYAEKLRAARVILSANERADSIEKGAKAAAAAAGLTLIEDRALLTENAGLTEWPVPLLGRFDEDFLDVPPEVIQLAMKSHQKYFSVADADGKLTNAFVCTANIEAPDGGTMIVAGNEKVLAARLADARFFWDQDRKVPLESHAGKLKDIVFHEKLGTVADKVERVAKLARWLVEEGIIPPLPRGEREQARAKLADQAERAARLAKADLVTGMVAEFPELQGLIGGYYAEAQGEDDAIAAAIRDHYKPVGQGDEVPTAPVTVAVSLADKLDSIVGFFGAGMEPTGSKDPFALRRSAIGILELATKNDLRFGLRKTLGIAAHEGSEDAGRKLGDFFADRLKVQQREAGVRHDLIDAVFALGGEDDMVRLLARVKALQAFMATDAGTALLAGYKRAGNILKAEAKKGDLPAAPDTLDYTPVPAEAALIAALDAAEPKAKTAVEAEDFEAAMTALAALRGPIDQFFDDVMVNEEGANRRAARLALLARITAAIRTVADFSRIEG
ncbi:glycine--tRNA ligase subunit beta [Pacificimonas sp. WHA3]|uniref:Glycine--tRNA ligase beta subunit n=1 Tax=Pacificimonas pallii TaxID=2827236 RepID=A0ABS6SC51_9SPHN|nr:glycine--tRNA ligase subunit beta [Pacificimonas pallii]MBV7255999.1 glycine--tRNA ligase subunit beta [Pacificimonas pallii]